MKYQLNDLESVLPVINAEGDRKKFQYRGLQCRCVRHPVYFHWCGYVEVPPEKAAGIRCDEPICHGGLTYKDEHAGSVILGFDAAHVGDWHHCPTSGFDGEYRTLNFAVAEIKKIADYVLDRKDDQWIQANE